MDEGDALIHLRVPASLKGRWVRVSRAAGTRLSDWIVQAVEARMEMQKTRPKPPPKYDYTGAARVAASRARTAIRLDIPLDAQHAECARFLAEQTDETAAALVRRLLREEAARLNWSSVDITQPAR